MSQLAFALKYRPQSFDEVIGQKHVVVSLENAISKKHIRHAYIFSGPRGVGKTSLARILAKSLNCFEGETVSPCGKCTSCVEINRGTSLDIIEIDGASNRGIDEIRSLREGVRLAPAYSKYKIYIIDEVHMLTQEAFNALLKTLEEPPAHVKFIFATTHPQKVLPTILSRCHRFQFNLISLEEIVGKLREIAEKEQITVEDNLLYSIGRASGGSVRDAESLFDQIVPVILSGGAVKDVLSFLGVIDEDTLNTVLKHLMGGDLESCLQFIDKLVKEGKDLGVFVNALLDHLRAFLLAKVSVKSFDELLDLSPQSKEFIIALCESSPAAQIVKLIDLLIESKELSHKLNTIRIPLELAVIKFTYQGEDTLTYSKEMKTVIKPEEVKQETVKQSILGMEGLDADIDNLDEDDSVNTQNVSSLDGEEVVHGVDDNILYHTVKLKWQQLLAGMQRVRAALSSHLSYAQPVSSSVNVLKIAFLKKDYFHKEIVEESKKSKVIEEMFSKFINKDIRIKFIFQDSVSSDSQMKLEGVEEKDSLPKETDEQKKSADDSDNEFINDLLDTFGGKITTQNE
jgi:DNA polymerase-3 subunit gamma/tau